MKIENLALKTFVLLALFAIGADAFRGAWVGGPEVRLAHRNSRCSDFKPGGENVWSGKWVVECLQTPRPREKRFESVRL
jgi:hypothetical protein